MIWIIDASVALKWLIEDEYHPNAEKVLVKVVDTPENFAVPELFGFEVFSVLQRLHPDGMNAFTKGIIPILQSGIFRQPMTESLVLKAGPYIKSGLTGYDACYAALAEDLNGVWLTFDQKAHKLIQKYNISFLLEKSMPAGWL
jgi:predicted nucleic acid-binding protein